MLDAPDVLESEIQLLERRSANGSDGRYFVPLADRYRRSGDLDRAEGLLRSGLERFPDYVSAYVVLGQILADRGQADESVRVFRRVLSADPQNLVALRTLGSLAASNGRLDEAMHWYQELLAADPMNYEAREALVGLSAAAAPPPSPSPELEPAPEPEPDPDLDLEFHVEPHDQAAGEMITETIAELYSQQGFHDRAAQVYRELLRRGPETPELQRRLAEAERMAIPVQPEPTIAETLSELLAWTPDAKH